MNIVHAAYQNMLRMDSLYWESLNKHHKSNAWKIRYEMENQNPECVKYRNQYCAASEFYWRVCEMNRN